MKRSWKIRHPVLWGVCVVCVYPLVLLHCVIRALYIGVLAGAISFRALTKHMAYSAKAMDTIRRIRTVRMRRKQIFG